MSILNEKLRALEILIRYETDLKKLKFCKRELDVISAELREAELSFFKKKSAKVLPFVPKDPARYAGTTFLA
jgi:hypothetical protein